MISAKNAAHFPRRPQSRLARPAALSLALVLVASATLLFPSLAWAHDAPESKQSRWVMADWMMDTFFVFAGLAVVAFVAAWKAGYFHELDEQAGIPLLIEEEDYYTPEWALEEEEWADGDAER